MNPEIKQNPSISSSRNENPNRTVYDIDEDLIENLRRRVKPHFQHIRSYRGGQFYWRRKLECPGETADLR